MKEIPSLENSVSFLTSHWGVCELISRAEEFHLQLIHRARILMVNRLLPPAARILDLGGANAPLYHMGYQHLFQELVMVDLPKEDRHEMYKDIDISVDAPGRVSIHYSDMTHLPMLSDESFDLIWSGQSIEHVDLHGGVNMCKEAFRLLKRGGHFCLDTPNRELTKIHTSDWHGGFIHPEHKHEYTNNELRLLLEKTGFGIKENMGVCEMPKTVETGKFHYTDFVVGNPLTSKPESAYCIYFDCVRP